VRTGQLYRSTELNHLAGEDLERFATLGIRVVFDLRTAPERDAEPDVVPAGTEQVVCDVLKDSQGAAPALLGKVLSDPAFAEQMLGGGKAVQLFERGYREIVSLPSALSSYREYFTRIAQDNQRPALFHCTTGKDRTGWAAAATLLLLGVSDQDVLYDYELTNRDLLPALKPVFEHFRAVGGDRHLLEPVLGVDAAYLQAGLDEMNQRFGSIEGYLGDGLGIDADGQQRLRDALVES
jgi:protein-tyrosine phosphatase